MVNLHASKQELFDLGVTLAKKFLLTNNIFSPGYYTFEEIFQRTSPHADTLYRHLVKLTGGPKQGYGTGWYYENNVFVNLKRAAWLVRKPACSSWSFPGYKVDREPCGVVAHEVGHHVDHIMGQPNTEFKALFDSVSGKDTTRDIRARAPLVYYHSLFCKSPSSRPEWRDIVKQSKPITSYEPNLHESFAESMRLFILNPDLLEQGSKPRFDFLLNCGLRPSETRDFRQVLDHPAYIAQAERWIAKKKK
jgi:hypothetical protein